MARVRALRNLRTPEAIGELVAALGDEDEGVRYFASSTLQWIGGDLAVATVRRMAAVAANLAAREEAERLLAALTA
jgi:HEAT repeat protein